MSTCCVLDLKRAHRGMGSVVYGKGECYVQESYALDSCRLHRVVPVDVPGYDPGPLCHQGRQCLL